ncbi:MAG: enoyl-CoA hydratase/isomerase family protein [Nitriliruptoraceae bacterium]|nr:enoyl-CoA hydratase/isomerase family protein [Nitriliruptoraceae bacterium]
MSEPVHLEVARGVATITLDSPTNRNALSAAVRRGLLDHLRTAIDDPGARVIVLTHTGTVFCAGMDLKEATGAGADAQGVNEFPRILATIWDSPTPVVARLAGTARAGGVGLVAACDLAIAADDVRFAFSEVRIGVVPAVISVTVLPRVQARAAHELLLTGEVFDAARAATIGLITRAVPAADLDAEVAAACEQLALGGPEALAATKQVLLRARGDDMDAEFDRMLALSARHFASEEGQEGIAAFVQKRPARWVPDGHPARGDG